jgi:SRSO17 transposase
MTSRFCFVRVRAGNDWEKAAPSPPREEWLIAEWPDGKTKPTDYWIANLPADAEPEQLARLRWKIELDYKQLKGELGLDHYEGRSWLGWYHHTALVTAAHGFMTLERQHQNHQRPA